MGFLNKFRTVAITGLVVFAVNCSGKTYLSWFEGFKLLDPTTETEEQAEVTEEETVVTNPDDMVELLSATAITPTQVRLVYDEPVTLSIAEVLANYSIVTGSTTLGLVGAHRDPSDSRVLFLDTTLQTAGAEYTVTVSNITGIDGSSLDPDKRTATFTGASNVDAQGPSVISASAIALNKVDVGFTEAVAASIATGNFTIHENATCAAGGTPPAVTGVQRNGANLSLVHLTLAAGLTQGTVYSVKAINAPDSWGNQGVASDCIAFNSFSTPAPKVVSAVSNSTTSLVITFSEEMSTTNLTNATYYSITGCQGAGNLDASTATVLVSSPTSVLLTGITVNAPVNAGQCMVTVDPSDTADRIESALLADLDNAADFAFFNYSTSDTTKPSIVSALPTSNTNIRVTFSEPIDNASVALSDFTLTGGATASAVTCGPGPSFTYCDLTTSSQTDTTYSLAVSGINDVAGNTLDATTTSVAGDGLPTVTNIIVADNGTIYITFSEPIGPDGNIAPGDFTICPASQQPCPPGTPLTINTADLHPTGTDPSNVIVLGTNPTSAGESYTLSINDSVPLITDDTSNGLNTTIDSPTFSGDSLPTVTSASSPSPSSILVQFSEPLNNGTVTVPGNYAITTNSGSCPTTVANPVQVSPGVVSLSVTGAVADGSCTVTANNLQDLNGNTIDAAAKSATFSYTGTGSGDTTSPTLLAVVSTSNTTARAFFNEPITAGGTTTGNYSIVPALTVTAPISCTGTYCDFTTSSQSFTTYQLTVNNVADSSGNIISGSNTANFLGTAISFAAPTVYLATVIDANTLDVAFSEAVDLVTAQATGNYAISTGSFTISSAIRQADNSIVRLVYAPGTFGSSTTYTVTVSNVTDFDAIAIGTPNSANFTGVDASAGSAPDLAAADDTGASSTDNITSQSNNLTFSGTVEANVPVTIYDNGVAIAATTSDSSGNYSIDIPTSGNLSDGSHNITVTVTGGSGEISAPSPAVLVQIDTSAPAAPTAAPALAAADDTGSSNSDGITSNNSNLTFTGAAGVAEAGSTISIYSDNPSSTLLATATVAGDGSYTVDIPGPLASGSHNITVTATDTAGNTSPASAAFSLQIDSSAPGTPGAAPTFASADDSGSSNSDGITNQNTNLTFTGTAGTVEASSTVTIYDNGTAVATVTAAGDGSYTIDIAGPISDGAHSITITSTDPAGNESSASAATAITIDTSAPATPGSAPSLAAADDTGASNSDGITSQTSNLTFSGTVEANARVQIYNGGTPVGTPVTADGSGNYTVDIAGPLGAGSHTITVAALDLAGNTSGTSPGMTLTIDTTAPGAPASVDLAAADVVQPRTQQG